MKLKPYLEYKDSGVPWLGEIPAHWDVKPGIAFLSERKEKNVGMKESTVLSLSYGQIIIKSPDKLHGLVPESFETYQIVEPGNIIIRGTDLQNDKVSLRVGKVRHKGIITSAYLCLQAKNGIMPDYAHVLLHTYDLMKVFYRLGSGLRQNLSYFDFKRLEIVVPSKEEQRLIHEYVRSTSAQINKFIRNKRRLIGLLKEGKQNIINKAVTKGLNENASTKYSGIDWVGNIPVHWETCRLRNIVSSVTSGSRGWSLYAADEGPLFIRIANLSRVSLDLKFDNIVRLDLPKTSETERTRIEQGDLLISITAYIGSIAVAPSGFGEAYVSQHVARCSLRKTRANPRWLGYVLLSEVGQTHGRLSLYGGTKDGLSLDDVKNYPILLPPREEQDSIVRYLDNLLSTLDQAIARAEREIELMTEYRARLISDVVTGKVDVRGIDGPQISEDELPTPDEETDSEDGFLEEETPEDAIEDADE